MPFGLHDPVKVTLLSCHQSRVWIDYIGDIGMCLVYFSLQQH